jgi:excisionase family DNA binding protein
LPWNIVLASGPHCPEGRPGAEGTTLVRIRNAARCLGVSVWTVREMQWAGTLPAVRLPGVRCLLYDRLDLEKLVEQGKN